MRLRTLLEALLPQVHAPAAPPWRLLPHMLLLAFVLRVVVALSGDFFVHSDEGQYLELAHAVVFGNGILSWEQYYGGRSWLLPGVVAGILLLCKTLGLGDPAYYIPAVQLFFCVFSLLIPLCMYILGRRLFSENCARIALLFGVLWYELVGTAGKVMTEFAATALLLVLLVLVLRPQRLTPAQAAGAAALAVFATAVRFQYAPLMAVALLPALVHGCARTRLMMAGGAAAMLCAVGVFDMLTWGSFLQPYRVNAQFNIEMSAFAEQHYNLAGYYLLWLLVASGGLLLPALTALPRRQCWFFLLLFLAVLLPHEAQVHREYRFIFVLIPLWLLLCAQFVCTLHRHRRALVLGWAGLASTAGIANALPAQDFVYKHEGVYFGYDYSWHFLRGQDELLPLYRRLAADDSVLGVTNDKYFYVYIGGYYYLHRKVPLYDAGYQYASVAEKLAHSSHIITPPPTAGLQQIMAGASAVTFAAMPQVFDSHLKSFFMHDAQGDALVVVHENADGRAIDVSILEEFAVAERGTQYTLWKRTPPAHVRGWQSYRFYADPGASYRAALENANLGKPPPPYHQHTSTPPAGAVE